MITFSVSKNVLMMSYCVCFKVQCFNSLQLTAVKAFTDENELLALSGAVNVPHTGNKIYRFGVANCTHANSLSLESLHYRLEG